MPQKWVEAGSNPFMTDCSGPRKVIDYSKAEGEVDNDDLYSYDLDSQVKAAFGGDGAYSVKF